MIEILVTAKLTEQDMKAIAKEVAAINSPKNIPKPQDEEPQYTVNEVAKMTKRKPWTIRNHISRGLLLGSKVGKGFLISSTDYNKYIKNKYITNEQ